LETFDVCTSATCRSKQHVVCASRDVALDPAAGFDNMTGLGAPNGGFVSALASK
jgi:hypothetical protein